MTTTTRPKENQLAAIAAAIAASNENSNDNKTCGLLFADKVILIAPNGNTLQIMLDILDEWCDKWNEKYSSI